MNEDQLTAILARTDAAAALLMVILIEKGVVSKSEMGEILDRALNIIDAQLGADFENSIMSSVFVMMKSFLKRDQSDLIEMSYSANIQ